MPKGKANGRRGGGTTGAERRAIARDLPAIKAIADSCDKTREEWRELGGDVSQWDRVGTLPESIGARESLTHLRVNDCVLLSELPSTIGKLEALEVLDMEGCSGLFALPNTISYLKALKMLDASGCTNLSRLPPDIDECSA